MKNLVQNQDGQSFVEFIFLLALISILSLGYLKIVNTNIAEFWRGSVTFIIDDKNEKVEVR